MAGRHRRAGRPSAVARRSRTSKPAPRHEVDFTLECSGNADTSSDFFIGGIGTARWGGARLAPLLEEAGVLDEATEVVFWGADRGTVTIRDNSGIVSGGLTGTVEPDADRRPRPDDHRAVRPQHVCSPKRSTATTCSVTR